MSATTCVDPDYLNAVMFMYSVGIDIEYICDYMGGIDKSEVNEIIDAYNECLL